jgi:uncharacterized damage-inducible protein DinB
MTLLDVLLQEAEVTYTITEQLFRRVTDGELAWKPATGEKWMTVGQAELLTRVFAAPWGGRQVSLFQHLLRMIAHLGQHKGQLFYYLKLMGKDVNTSDLWGS